MGVHPLVRAAVAVAALSALGAPALLPPVAAGSAPVSAASASDGETRTERGCPERSLSLRDGTGKLQCVPLPAADDVRPDRGARGRRLAQTRIGDTPRHFETSAVADHVPRLPDRPEDWRSYQLPVDPLVRVYAPEESFDGRPRHGIELAGEPGAAVTLVDLAEQTGDAEVVLVGELYGVTVAVRQRVKGPAGERTYLVIYGRLARPGPSIVNGAELGPLSVIGYLHDEEEPTVYVEVREQQAEPRQPAAHLHQLVDSGLTVAIDPRNVFPLAKK